MKRGFTLVECMLASAILGLVVLALFEGVIVSTRIAHENSELLAAEAFAWDVAWTRFNANFDDLETGTTTITLTDDDAPPQLAESKYSSAYYDAPELTITVGLTDEEGFSKATTTMKKITTDLKWGPENHRHSLSEYGRCPQVFRGKMGRTN